MEREKLKSRFSKHRGLKLIEHYNLPYPEWKFFNNPEDIQKNPWAKAPYGWTIRCCPTKEYRFGLPSVHRLDYSQLKRTLKKLSQDTGTSTFVIYPSWEFDLSGCVLISSEELLIEVVKGDIAALLKGQKSPDAIYKYSRLKFSKLDLIKGEKDLLTTFDKSLFLNTTSKIITKSTIILEWSKTNEGKILFHDFIEIY